MGSDFNVSSIARDKVTKTVTMHRPQLFEEKGEPERNRTEVLQNTSLFFFFFKPALPPG